MARTMTIGTRFQAIDAMSKPNSGLAGWPR